MYKMKNVLSMSEFRKVYNIRYTRADSPMRPRFTN